MIRRQLLLVTRYRLDFAAQPASMYGFFIVIFVGGRAAMASVGSAPSSFSGTFEGLIVGWILWTMSQDDYTSLQGDVTAESVWGTLEQLYMSPYGFGTVMIVKIIVNLLVSLLLGAIMLLLMILTTGNWLGIDLITVLPVIVLTLASIVGVGFVFAGLALVYKKITSVASLMNFAIIGLIAAPVVDIYPIRFLPLAQESALLQDAMRNGDRLWDFPAHDLGSLVGTAIGYFFLGYVFFRYCTRVARSRGVMGHY